MSDPNCESCGDRIKNTSEDPDLCKGCFDGIFSGPPKAVIQLPQTAQTILDIFGGSVVADETRLQAERDILDQLGMG